MSDDAQIPENPPKDWSNLTGHFLFIRPGALGDALLAFPVLACFKRICPNIQITLVTRRDVLALARSSEIANDTLPFDSSVWVSLFVEPQPITNATVTSLRHRLRDTYVIAWMPMSDGVVMRNLKALGASNYIVAAPRPTPDEHVHAAIVLTRALRHMNIPVPDDADELVRSLPPLTASADAQSIARHINDEILQNAGSRWVAIHPGSGGAAKRWQPARFGVLAERIRDLGYTPILLEGPQDAEPVAACLASATAPIHVLRDLDVDTLAALLPYAAAYVGNDSGVSHLAGLCGVPTLALFGHTDPAQWSPLGPSVVCLRSPTTQMDDVTLEAAAEALADLLKSTIDRRGPEVLT